MRLAKYAEITQQISFRILFVQIENAIFLAFYKALPLNGAGTCMSLDVSESDSILRDKNVASTWHGGELKGNISHFDRTHEKKAINDNKIVTPNIASQNIQNQPPLSSSPGPAQNQTLNANNIQNSIPDIETQIKRTETGGGTCLICNKTYSKLFNCRKHFQETHVGNVPPTCSFRNKTYASSRSKCK